MVIVSGVIYMNEQQNIKITDEDLKAAFEGESKKPRKSEGKSSKKKKYLWFLIPGICTSVIGIALIVVGVLMLGQSVTATSYPQVPSKETKNATYSLLTGEKLEGEASQKAPAYCIQTPNGTDGARPQAGLNEAGVIFEAVAEAGITRFAAIYQEPSSGIIGPIRSLRIYYLEWDTPFDCTIVHAGGASDAISALSSGGYKELDENNTYMYRGSVASRRWNNLFTTSTDLQQYSEKIGKNESDIKGFARLTPEESKKAQATGANGHELEITKPAEGNTSEVESAVSDISLKFGGIATFNVNYTYDAESNTYLRSYANGLPHEVYKCPSGDLSGKNPEDQCELTQMAPSVVVAMIVPERRAADNYHEDIDTLGSGDAYIFQNGIAIKGTWNKASTEDQIKFKDVEGKEVKLAPGQTFISAIPNYGSVDY